MAGENVDPPKLPEKSYGEVIITLENCTLSEDKLTKTPSVLDGLSLDTETDLRILGCEYIQTSGILLKLPQVAMATAQVLFQRFYYSKSFVKHNMEIVAMACVNLASKIEEAPRRPRDVINVFHHIRQKRSNKTVEPMVLDSKYITTKNNVIKAERRVLKELGFCVHVKHPHKMIVTYLQVLECETNKRLVQTAWNYMNDSLRTHVFMRYPPETIACACIYLSARQLNIFLPNNPPWYRMMGATEKELQDIALTILRLYARGKKTYSELDKEVDLCRKNIQTAKLQAKGLLAGDLNSLTGTPTGFSPHSSSRPNSPKVKTESPAATNTNKALNSTVKEEPNTINTSAKHENGKLPPLKNKRSKSRSRSRSRSISSGRSSRSSRSRSHSRDRKPRNRMKKESRKRNKHDNHEQRHRPRSRKRKHSRSFSRSRSRSRSRSSSYERKLKYRQSPSRHHRSHERIDKYSKKYSKHDRYDRR